MTKYTFSVFIDGVDSGRHFQVEARHIKAARNAMSKMFHLIRGITDFKVVQVERLSTY